MIGVDDDKTVVGINEEYPIADKQKQNWDGYHLNMVGRLSRLSLTNSSGFCKFERIPYKGVDICRVTVQPAPEPVYIDYKFFFREGPRKHELSVQEGHDYIVRHWKK